MVDGECGGRTEGGAASRFCFMWTRRDIPNQRLRQKDGEWAQHAFDPGHHSKYPRLKQACYDGCRLSSPALLWSILTLVGIAELLISPLESYSFLVIIHKILVASPGDRNLADHGREEDWEAGKAGIGANY